MLCLVLLSVPTHKNEVDQGGPEFSDNLWTLCTSWDTRETLSYKLLTGFQIDRHDDDSLFCFCPLEVDPLVSTQICLSLIRNHRVVWCRKLSQCCHQTSAFGWLEQSPDNICTLGLRLNVLLHIPRIYTYTQSETELNHNFMVEPQLCPVASRSDTSKWSILEVNNSTKAVSSFLVHSLRQMTVDSTYHSCTATSRWNRNVE